MSKGPFLRKYGVQTTLNFDLFEVDGVNFRLDAVHATADTKIMKDEGAEANTTNGFTDEGQGYSIVLTATEMQAARIKVYIVDAATKVWLDTSITVETYGNASALHAFDLDTASTAQTGDSFARIGAAGAGLTAINLPNQTMDIVGNITGDLSGSVGSVTGAVGSVTGNVGGNVTGSVGSLVGHTVQTGDSFALANGLAGFVAIDTVVDAIKAKTDALPADPADQSLIIAATDANLAAIGALNDISAADVNAEVVDVLKTDVITLPGQTAPPLTPTFEQALSWLYKVLRNRKTQTAAQWSLLADDETTVDAKATVSDDGTTAVKQEIVTGP